MNTIRDILVFLFLPGAGPFPDGFDAIEHYEQRRARKPYYTLVGIFSLLGIVVGSTMPEPALVIIVYILIYWLLFPPALLIVFSLHSRGRVRDLYNSGQYLLLEQIPGIGNNLPRRYMRLLHQIRNFRGACSALFLVPGVLIPILFRWGFEGLALSRITQSADSLVDTVTGFFVWHTHFVLMLIVAGLPVMLAVICLDKLLGATIANWSPLTVVDGATTYKDADARWREIPMFSPKKVFRSIIGFLTWCLIVVWRGAMIATCVWIGFHAIQFASDLVAASHQPGANPLMGPAVAMATIIIVLALATQVALLISYSRLLKFGFRGYADRFFIMGRLIVTTVVVIGVFSGLLGISKPLFNSESEGMSVLIGWGLGLAGLLGFLFLHRAFHQTAIRMKALEERYTKNRPRQVATK